MTVLNWVMLSPNRELASVPTMSRGDQAVVAITNTVKNGRRDCGSGGWP